MLKGRENMVKISKIAHKIAKFFRSEGQASAPSAPATALPGGASWADWLGIPTAADCVATAYRCQKVLRDSVAQLPMLYMRQRGDVFVEDTASRLSYLLRVQPNEEMSAYVFWSRLVGDLVAEGNAYVVPVYAGAEIHRLAYVKPSCVARSQDGRQYTINDYEAKVAGVYDEEDVLHFIWQPDRWAFGGEGVSRSARTALSIAKTGDQQALRNNTTGGQVRGFLANASGAGVPGWGQHQDGQLESMAKIINESINVSGDSIGYLPSDVKWLPLGSTAGDMQFMESRKFAVREICRFYGVPPSFVFDDTSNNYKSAEMANTDFMRNTLNPLLRSIEGELLRKLCPPSLALKRKFVFDRQELNACDLTSKAGYYSKMLGCGWSVNDVRAREGMPKVEGGDRPLVSANLRFFDEGDAVANTNETETQKDNENE